MIAVQTHHCGVLHVYVQGNLDERNGKTIILTCHDVGTNYKTFVRFVNHPTMVDVKNKSIFLHVCVPGQEDNAADYIGEYVLIIIHISFLIILHIFYCSFPTLDNIAEDLSCVLDKLDVKSCIVFGEGAGANILCRFAMENSNRILGIILVHCTSTTAGIVEYCKDKVTNIRLENDIMTDGAWEYLVSHKFGTANKKDRQFYVDELKRTLNPRNLSKYLLAFTKRTDLSSSIGSKLDKAHGIYVDLFSVDTLLVSGSKASHLHTVYSTQKSMNRRKTTLLIVDNVADVLQEAPENMARSLILLCKGCGVLSGVAIPGMERQRTLSSSMEEADRPRRLSVTQPTLPTVPSN
ncbi:Ndr family protein [Dictyocaulus viviparus]|uniref:Ndr family protein n=1 Tax=Dictyocaulus viviparus TaxID=29172 RepID=A0A0D8XJ32_DICVI|nr:Ndr family protein [Dictyocaulus viviparus]